jgi:hypothetical protein
MISTCSVAAYHQRELRAEGDKCGVLIEGVGLVNRLCRLHVLKQKYSKLE